MKPQSEHAVQLDTVPETPFNAAPWFALFGSLLTCVVFLVAVAQAVVHVVDSPLHVAHVTLPPVDSVTWEEEITAYAGRLEQAFDLDTERAQRYAPWILTAAARQRLDPDLVAGLVFVESSFREHVRSHTGAIGPAQVNPRFWRQHCGGQPLTDPAHNINCGAIALTHYADRCGDMECALRKYNVGPSNLRRQHQAALRYVAKIGRSLDMMADQAL